MGFFLLSANLAMAFALILTFNKLPPQIPLFYSRAGEFQIADWWLIFLLPLLMNGLILLDVMVYRKFFFGNTFVKALLHYFRLFLILSFTLIFLKIVFLIS